MKKVTRNKAQVRETAGVKGEYVTHWTSKSGMAVTIRPIRPEDERPMVEFHKSLSETSVHFRYFGMLKLEQRIGHERLALVCFPDDKRGIALVVDRKNPQTGEHEILGVGRLCNEPGRDEAEFAIVIGDPWQRHGLGMKLLKELVQIGREEKLTRIFGHILSDNLGMRAVAKKAGFQIRPGDDGESTAEILF